MNTHLVWFRQDLRITDNSALFNACLDKKARVIAIYIATPCQWRQHTMSARQAKFIYDNLVLLEQALTDRGIPLLYRQCDHFVDSVSVIEQVCQQYQVTKLFFNNQYRWNEKQRDKQLEQALSQSVECHRFDDSLLFAPATVVNAQGSMYKVFTPFRHACLQQLAQVEQRVLPAPDKRELLFKSDTIEPFDYPLQDYSFFPAGEAAALKQLHQFCDSHLADYSKLRDIPSIDGTSKLSAYLAIGVLSVRQCFQCLLTANIHFWQSPQCSEFVWFNELLWREFYTHLLLAYPKLSRNKPFIDWTAQVKWRNDMEHFKAWQTGQTGYPIVDAAMRQLNQTGWMHNRLRMIVASFLVKDLLIDWRWGEKYFMSQLIDGDLAANNGGWQWAASTGTDAMPYFRIFNPTTQGQRFDPQGVFIRQWLPELASVPDKMIHTPHSWAEKQQLVLDYPLPIVPHDQARKTTLAAFQTAKQYYSHVAAIDDYE